MGNVDRNLDTRLVTANYAIAGCTLAGSFFLGFCAIVAAYISRPVPAPSSPPVYSQAPAPRQAFVDTRSLIQEIADAEEKLAAAMTALKEAADREADAQDGLTNAISTVADVNQLITRMRAARNELTTQVVEIDARLPVLEARAKTERTRASELWEESKATDALVKKEFDRIRAQFHDERVKLLQREQLYREIGHKRWQNIETGVTFTTDADPNSFTGMDGQGYPIGRRITLQQRLEELRLQEEESHAIADKPAVRARQAAQRQDAIADTAEDRWTELMADRKRSHITLNETKINLRVYEEDLATAETRREAAASKLNAAKIRSDPERTEVERLQKALEILQERVPRYAAA